MLSKEPSGMVCLVSRQGALFLLHENSVVEKLQYLLT
jgi:hypothetical protein